MSEDPSNTDDRVQTVRVSDELWERATSLAAANGHSISDVVRWSLQRYVSRFQAPSGRRKQA